MKINQIFDISAKAPPPILFLTHATPALRRRLHQLVSRGVRGFHSDGSEVAAGNKGIGDVFCAEDVVVDESRYARGQHVPLRWSVQDMQ